MSNESFLISLKQNNDLSDIAVQEIRVDCSEYPLNQRAYIQMASLPGNSRKYALNRISPKIGPLWHKQILFLGSSVTFGFGSLGESFVDYLWKADGVQGIKDAENGETLVGTIDETNKKYDPDSYVNRFRAELDATKPDVFVLQLSTNDATQNKPLGEISYNGKFNTETITGALEFIISKAEEKWKCPILVFTNPYFDNVLYKEMVQRTKELAKKYHFELLNLFEDPNFNGQKQIYMADKINPTRAGYLEKWLPNFEEKLTSMTKK